MCGDWPTPWRSTRYSPSNPAGSHSARSDIFTDFDERVVVAARVSTGIGIGLFPGPRGRLSAHRGRQPRVSECCHRRAPFPDHSMVSGVRRGNTASQSSDMKIWQIIVEEE